MVTFGMTGKYEEIDRMISKKRYEVKGNPRGAATFELIDPTLPFSGIEYREYEADTEETAIEMARKEGLKTPIMSEIMLPLFTPEFRNAIIETKRPGPGTSMDLVASSIRNRGSSGVEPLNDMAGRFAKRGKN